MTEATSQAQPPVSVVIATRNRWAEVQQAVDSCLAQDYPALEIAVYDDASEENIAQKLQDKYPTIKVSRSDAHMGQIVLRNRGSGRLRAGMSFLWMMMLFLTTTRQYQK
jgi:cellulose synthase/poly-beta-1,6-N-acetylglucosamine synthase-like glycosyltransferase